MSEKSEKKAKKSRRRRRSGGLVDVVNGMLSLVLIGLLIVGGIFLYGVHRFNEPGPIPEEARFLVEPGNHVSTIAQRLDEQGLIENPAIFRLGSVALRRDTDIKAGEFRIAARSSMADILRELTEGEPIRYAVTIPEGFTSWQVVQRVNADDNLTGTIESIPPEGSLLPQTYNYQRGDTRQSVITRMQTAMDDAVATVWENRDPDLPLETPGDLVTLASIIEKETAVPEERDRVAAVFVNRLNTSMRLQSDPTIIYGITDGEGSLGRGLYRSEIEETTPYNTYQIDGLPPGPIANPGIASLRAAANPAETDELYFVADGTGGHVFANSYAEHQDNVATWRRIEAEQAAEEEAEPAAQDEMDALEQQEAEAAGVDGAGAEDTEAPSE